MQYSEKKKRVRAKISPKKSSNTNSPKSKLSGCAIVFFGYIGIYAAAFIIIMARGFFKLTTTSGFNVFLLIAAFIVQVIFSFMIMKNSIRLDKKSGIVPAFLGPLALAFGLVVMFVNPAHDYWYYGAALACLVVLVINGLSMINHFNYLTTRPVPNFFSREGADNEA